VDISFLIVKSSSLASPSPSSSLELPSYLDAGEYTLLLVAKDSQGNSASCPFYITVLVQSQPFASLQMISGAQGQLLHEPVVSLPTNSTLKTFTVTSGQLPYGTLIDSSSGRLVGTPLLQLPRTNSTITICNPRDASAICGSIALSIEIVAFSVSVSFPSTFIAAGRRNANAAKGFFPKATLGVEFSTPGFNITSSKGGSGCITFRTVGSLPPGLVMESSGALRGTPSHSTGTNASYSFQIVAVDASTVTTNVNGDQTFVIQVHDCDDTETCVNGICHDEIEFDGLYDCICDAQFTNDPANPLSSCTLPVSNTDKDGSSSSTSTISGAVGGSAAFLLILISLVLWILYKVRLLNERREYTH
jgi:hypothetical protein